jgi:hypothetical protein
LSKSATPISAILFTSAAQLGQRAKWQATTAASASGWLPAEQLISVAMSGWCLIAIYFKSSSVSRIFW